MYIRPTNYTAEMITVEKEQILIALQYALDEIEHANGRFMAKKLDKDVMTKLVEELK